MESLVYARAGDNCVEIVMVTHETVWGEDMPVLRAVPLTATQARGIATRLLNLAEELDARQDIPARV